MKRTWMLSVCVAAMAFSFLGGCGTALAESTSVDANAVGANWAVWGMGNGEYLGAAFCRNVTERVQAGLEAFWIEELPDDGDEACSLAGRLTWDVAPKIPVPIGGWFPVELGIPESVDANVYIGGALGMEFLRHDAVADVIAGGQINTGTHATIGLEYRYKFQNFWNSLADTERAHVLMLTLMYEF